MHGIKVIGLGMAFNGLDVISGLLVAMRSGKVVSSKLRDGLFKKAGFMLCYFLAWMVDNYGGLIGYELGIKVLPIMVMYAVLTEAVSIIENAHRLNPGIIPGKVKALLGIEKEG